MKEAKPDFINALPPLALRQTKGSGGMRDGGIYLDKLNDDASIK